MPMKKSNDSIGNRTRDLPACSAVPQPTAPTGVTVVETCLLNYTASSFSGAVSSYDRPCAMGSVRLLRHLSCHNKDRPSGAVTVTFLFYSEIQKYTSGEN
jgi:hypothetical protein